ncbi:MAG TPA: DUF411 domain-containing protein [Allosphingosinicella sp.]|jgi:hypothetical protein|nr:DUF411 domain-containing protein [Allosphingosinicella sp.]
MEYGTMDRRTLIGLVGGAAAWPLLAGPSGAAAPTGYVMWRDPGCGCCLEWAKRIEAAFGRKLPVVNAPNMAAVKKAQGVPAQLQSCHTALIQGVVVEGHVPPEDIKRLIASGRKGVKGLATPGMPAGAPGMDVGHDVRQRYQVFAFDPAGRRSVFATHG